MRCLARADASSRKRAALGTVKTTLPELAHSLHNELTEAMGRIGKPMVKWTALEREYCRKEQKSQQDDAPPVNLDMDSEVIPETYMAKMKKGVGALLRLSQKAHNLKIDEITVWKVASFCDVDNYATLRRMELLQDGAEVREVPLDGEVEEEEEDEDVEGDGDDEEELPVSKRVSKRDLLSKYAVYEIPEIKARWGNQLAPQRALRFSRVPSSLSIGVGLILLEHII